MKRRSIPFGEQMGMKVAFSNLITVDLTDSTRMVWVSGQLAYDEQGNIVGKDNIGLQIEQCLLNIQTALHEVGGSLDDIVKVTVFVKEMSGLKEVHNVRLNYFKEPYPTSTLVQITDFVTSDALIEIEAQAVIAIK